MVQRLSVWLQEGRVAIMSPPEDPPCDASIANSSRWCGALVRHPREQCNVHSIPIPFNVTKLSHLFPLKTSNQRNWGPRSAAKGSHGLDTGEIKLSPDEMILKYRKIVRNGDVIDDSFAPTSKHALLVNIQTLFFGWWDITVISSQHLGIQSFACIDFYICCLKPPAAIIKYHGQTTFSLLDESLSREIECTNDNPHLTFETIVTRVLRRVSESFHLPWSHILELSRQAPYLMDSNLHQDLLKIWHQRSKNTTLDEQHCVERILGRDNVRSSDLIKLIGILHKISDPKTVYEFFAMDGYQGDDPKKYVELFRYDAEDVRGKHVRAVRLLYRDEVVNTPQECRSFLESIFDGTCTNTEYKDMYVEHVRGQLTDMAEWRQQTKKKRPAEEDARDAKKVATED
ncbi:uncharacterized protein TNCV_360671 [Trichonephila clavipes]|nr:uncharacterized protein TNCV_360671 [Trichonephila clavipes]